MRCLLKKSGQATIEYVLVFALIGILTLKMAKGFTNYLALSTGNLAHVLSVHLTLGVCKRDCFYSGYVNGSEN